jgi:hypothetical protein
VSIPANDSETEASSELGTGVRVGSGGDRLTMETAVDH